MTLEWSVEENTLTISGNLSSKTLTTMYQSISNEISKPINCIDLSAIKMIDSAGLALIAYIASKQAALFSTTIRCVIAPELSITPLVKVYGLDRLLTIEP